MTPNTLRRRKNESQEKIRKKERISRARSKIQRRLWDKRKDSSSSSQDSSENDDDFQSITDNSPL